MTTDPTCPACAAPLPAGARFCPSCGAPLAVDPVTEERRIVSVLFADIEGFTSLAEQRDPESVKELLDACFGRLVPVVVAFGGHVDKIIGDEVMAVFGAPVAHEDDPERAVRAALALAPALAEVDPGLRLRVGVNTGEVMTGTVGPGSSYTVTGDVVNTAHRLAAAARPGEVLVGERTRHATAGGVHYVLRGDLDLKGKQDKVRAWVATDAAGRPAHRGADQTRTPLVGRADDLAELAGEVRRALAGRRAEVHTLVGEAGVGKTRLSTELAELLASEPDGPQVLWAACPPYGPSSDLTPLADVVRAGLGVAASVDRADQERILAERATAIAAATGTDAVQLRSRLALLLGLEPVSSRSAEPETGPARAGLAEQQLATVATVLAHLAAVRPLLVVVDDLHWAGPLLLRFVSQAPDRLDGHPVVLLTLARDDLLERRAGPDASGPGHRTRTLGPLTPDASSELVLALLDEHRGGPPVRIGPGALDRLVTAAGGNPLLIDQLVRYLVESGALVARGGRWQWTTDAAGNEAGLPDGVRSLIGARLDALPADERVVLSYAAVLGRRFWRDALVELSGAPDVDVLLARLADRGLTEAVPDDGDGDLAFRHVLTRDVAYASLPIGDRAIRHARVARWLERRVRDAPEPSATGQLAHHYERAVVLARAVDHADPGLTDAAFAALVRAARDAHQRHGLHRADHWYRRARDLGTIDTTAMLDVVAEHGSVLLELRQLDAAREAFEELDRRAGTGRPALRATAAAHLGAAARLAGDIELARERFEAASSLLRALDDRQGLADVLRLQGWSELTVGRARAALPRFRQAEALEEQLAAPARRGETLRYLGWCELLAGELGAARTHLRTAIEHARDVGDHGSAAWCAGLLAHILLQTGQVTAGLEVARELRIMAQRNADPAGEWTCVTLQASGLVALGDLDGAAELAMEAARRFEELDEAWGLALARVVRAQAARLSGDLATARALLGPAIDATRELVHVGEEARLVAELARVELDAGDLAEAERLGRSALSLVRAGIGDHESGLRSLLVLAEVARAQGSPDAAELLLEEAADDRPPGDRTDGWRQAAVALAELRLAAGDPGRARDLVARCRVPATEEVRLLAQLDDLEGRLAAHVPSA